MKKVMWISLSIFVLSVIATSSFDIGTKWEKIAGAIVIISALVTWITSLMYSGNNCKYMNDNEKP